MHPRTLSRRVALAACFTLCNCAPPDQAASADTEPAAETGADGTDEADGGNPIGPVTPELLASRGSCPAQDGAGTDHMGDITADETWTAADGPHHIPYHLRILATVTIEPCARVLVDQGMTIDVGTSDRAGQLIARGQATDDDVRPVNFQASVAGQTWGHLQVGPMGNLELSVVALQDSGGATINELGAVVVQGVAGGTNAGEPTYNATLDRVLIAGSASYGLNLAAWGALSDDSTEIWIRDGGGEDAPSAVRIEPGVASSLPEALEISGNVRDEILVATSKAFMRDDTWADHGVPYRQRGPLYVNSGVDGTSVTLSIDAGVTVAFEESAGSGMIIGSSDARQGVLIVAGTADAPVLFTSAQDAAAAGDWMGIVFQYVPTQGAHISHARIEYAGGQSGHDSFGCGPKDNDAAIIVRGQGPDSLPPDPVVDDTEFDEIGGQTVIVSGWSGDGPNLATTNTFGPATPACKVSQPVPTTGCDGSGSMCW